MKSRGGQLGDGGVDHFECLQFTTVHTERHERQTFPTNRAKMYTGIAVRRSRNELVERDPEDPGKGQQLLQRRPHLRPLQTGDGTRRQARLPGQICQRQPESLAKGPQPGPDSLNYLGFIHRDSFPSIADLGIALRINKTARNDRGMNKTPSGRTSRKILTGAALVAALSIGTFAGIPIGASTAMSGTTPEVSAVAYDGYDAATRDDVEFNQQFEHKFATVDDVKMHYVTGGEGPPLVLIHGWPQTWFEWRDIMPALAEHRTVYAIDLPGLGDSEGTPRGFDKKTLAQYVNGLLEDHLQLGAADIIAHDLGAGVGFQYASQFPDAVNRYLHLDYPLPSSAVLPAQQYRTFSWHMSFNSQPTLPEQLVDDPDDVREYLKEFYTQVAYGGAAFGGNRTSPPFTSAQIDEYTRTYSRPDILSNGFELYRTLEQDQNDNDNAATVNVPTKLVTATGSLANTEPTLAPLFGNLQETVEIPDSGHWLPEENPTAVVHEILDFIRG